eukprot:jgi/Mesen1/9088/ME000058S08580
MSGASSVSQPARSFQLQRRTRKACAASPSSVTSRVTADPVSQKMQSLTITQPDDWHLHLRDGPGLMSAVPHSARVFKRAIIMPNLRPPVTTTEAAIAYRERILAALPPDSQFEPLMTLYLTDVFIERVLAPLVSRLPGLRVVMEHITTADAAHFVESCADGAAVLKAVTSGSARKRFFLGTDSAPHERATKEAACGCAGIFSAHAALPLYARAFEEAGALDKLEDFASFNGPDFYGLPRNTQTVTLERSPWTVPDSYEFGSGTVVPMCAGERLDWTVG